MSMMGALGDLFRAQQGRSALPEDAQYDPFTGMPFTGSAPVTDPGPSTADAYRMGGLASMDQYMEGPPHAVFGGYDKAVTKADKRQADLEASPLGRGMLAAQQAFPGAQQRGPLAGAAEFAKDVVLPSSLTDAGLMFAGGPLGRTIGALGATLDPAEAQAGKGSVIGRGARRAATALEDVADQGVKNWKLGDVATSKPLSVVPPDAREYTRRYSALDGEVNAGVDAPTNKRIQTVADPYRMMYPGIYGNPREIAAEAGSRVIPESPAMQQLWGVSRGDLDAMAQGRVGNEAPKGVIASERGRGSLAAQNIMLPKNEQRLQDILYEGGRIPGLKHADAWYIMDPVYQRLEQMFGPQEAVQRFRHLNTMMGMASPGSDVLTEIQRGSAAHWLQQQGRFEDFLRYGGTKDAARGSSFPDDMRYIGAHPYHGTSQAGPMGQYLERGALESESPKVPLYVHASGVPQTGFQTSAPVGDAHFSRGVGLADTRKGPTDVGASFSRPEYETMAPWWRDKVAGQLGIESVPAQARLWTVLGPQTGVDSPLGQGKLELLSQQIVKAAKRLNVSPETARDLVLSGGAGAGALMLAPKIGDLAAPDRYSN